MSNTEIRRRLWRMKFRLKWHRYNWRTKKYKRRRMRLSSFIWRRKDVPQALTWLKLLSSKKTTSDLWTCFEALVNLKTLEALLRIQVVMSAILKVHSGEPAAQQQTIFRQTTSSSLASRLFKAVLISQTKREPASPTTVQAVHLKF